MASLPNFQILNRKQVKRPLEIPPEGDEHTRNARREIDDDISKLEHRIRVLKTRRNNLSPISVLPPEVLSKIFVLIRDSLIGSKYHGHETYWIHVGQVCRNWREIALGCSGLWSVPVFTRPDLAQEMVRRSKTAPLDVVSTVATWTPRMLEELENAMGQIYRIQSIDFTLASYSKEVKVILSSLSRPAPLLQKVTLSDTTYHTHSLPVNALSDAPHLRTINFDRLDWIWESAIFRNRNLTTLRLKDNHAVTNSPHAFGQMINALDHLPNLRILELKNSIPSHMTSSGNEETLEFKFLEQLILSDKAVDCITFLRHIQYPSRATVVLYSSSTEVEDCETIFSIISKNLYRTQAGTPHSPPTIRSARLVSMLGTADFFFSDKTEHAKHVGSNHDIPITRIQLNGSLAIDKERDRLLMSVYKCFDLSSLEALSMFWGSCSEKTHNILGKLPKLDYIRVCIACLDFCIAIAGTPEDVPTEKPEVAKTRHSSRRGEPQEALPPVTVFPALKTLVIEGGDFRQRQFQKKMECLADTLAKRSDMNAPVDRLRLEGCCGVGDLLRRRLGEFVTHLEVEENICLRGLNYDSDLPWDGRGEGDEEESDEDDSFDEYDDDISDEYD